MSRVDSTQPVAWWVDQSTPGRVTVGNGWFSRTAEIVPISADCAIAYLDFVCDRGLVRAAAGDLARIAGPLAPECLVAPAVGAIPLCYALAELLDVPYVVLRKGVRSYMGACRSTSVQSVASRQPEQLVLEDCYLPLLAGSRVVLLDTVATSGATHRAMETLVEEAGAAVVARAVAFVEGEGCGLPGLLYLGVLPVFSRSE